MTPNVSVHESSQKLVESIHGSCLLTRPASSASSFRSSVPAATPHGALEGGGTPSPYAGVVRYPRAPLPTNGGAGSSSSSDRQHIGRGQRGHGQRPDARERIGAQTARPVQCVLGIAPAWALLRQHRGGGLLDRGHALAVAPLGQRVSARPGSLAVHERHVARLGQGHQRVAAEPEHPGPAPNDQPLHPLARPGRIHAQAQPVAVAIEPGLEGSLLTDRRQGGASSSHACRGHHVSRPPTPGELVLADLVGGQRGGSRPGRRSRERPAAANAAVVGVATAATPPDAPASRVPRSRAGSCLWPVREPRRTGGRCPATAAPGRVPVPGGRAPLCGGASYEAEG